MAERCQPCAIRSGQCVAQDGSWARHSTRHRGKMPGMATPPPAPAPPAAAPAPPVTAPAPAAPAPATATHAPTSTAPSTKPKKSDVRVVKPAPTATTDRGTASSSKPARPAASKQTAAESSKAAHPSVASSSKAAHAPVAGSSKQPLPSSSKQPEAGPSQNPADKVESALLDATMRAQSRISRLGAQVTTATLGLGSASRISDQFKEQADAMVLHYNQLHRLVLHKITKLEECSIAVDKAFDKVSDGHNLPAEDFQKLWSLLANHTRQMDAVIDHIRMTENMSSEALDVVRKAHCVIHKLVKRMAGEESDAEVEVHSDVDSDGGSVPGSVAGSNAGSEAGLEEGVDLGSEAGSDAGEALSA